MNEHYAHNPCSHLVEAERAAGTGKPTGFVGGRMIANEYGHYDKHDMADRLHGDIAHFAKKHGCIPTKVVFNPEFLPAAEGVTIQGEKGDEYEVKLVSDPKQLKMTYRIVREDGE